MASLTAGLNSATFATLAPTVTGAVSITASLNTEALTIQAASYFFPPMSLEAALVTAAIAQVAPSLTLPALLVLASLNDLAIAIQDPSLAAVRSQTAALNTGVLAVQTPTSTAASPLLTADLLSVLFGTPDPVIYNRSVFSDLLGMSVAVQDATLSMGNKDLTAPLLTVSLAALTTDRLHGAPVAAGVEVAQPLATLEI